MASQIFNKFKSELMKGNIDLDGDTIKAELVSTNTTVDTENDGIDTVSDFATLDICDGANYAIKTLTTTAVTQVDASDLAKFSADNVTWTALGASTRAIQGVLIYKFNTTQGDSTPICFIQFSSNKTADGSDFTVSWDGTNGIFYLT